MAVTDVYDCTTAHVAQLPPGMAAGYDTGPGVAWTPAQWAAHPGALHYDQDPRAAVPTADLLDIEALAATPADAARWLGQAQAAWMAGTRPGQRAPGLYCSRSKMTPVVNMLLAGGVRSALFVIADYTGGRAAAAAEVEASAGPWRIIGRQYAVLGPYDASVFSNAWLNTVNTRPPGPANWTEAIVDALPMLGPGAGMTVPNEDVKTVQRLLGGRNGPAVAVDGRYGTATATAVRLFQHQAGLALVDGVTGPATWPKLLNR